MRWLKHLHYDELIFKFLILIIISFIFQTIQSVTIIFPIDNLL